MKTLYLAVAFVLSGASVHACDGVSALSGSCHSQKIVRERVEVPVYKQQIVVERVEVPQYVERERIRERVVVKRERRLRDFIRGNGVRKEVRVERIRSY